MIDKNGWIIWLKNRIPDFDALYNNNQFDDFIDGVASFFNRLYEDITKLVELVDYENCPQDYLLELAETLGQSYEIISKIGYKESGLNIDFNTYNIFNRISEGNVTVNELNRLRKYIIYCVLRFKEKGTPFSLERLLKVYGITASVIELWVEDFKPTYVKVFADKTPWALYTNRETPENFAQWSHMLFENWLEKEVDGYQDNYLGLLLCDGNTVSPYNTPEITVDGEFNTGQLPAQITYPDSFPYNYITLTNYTSGVSTSASPDIAELISVNHPYDLKNFEMASVFSFPTSTLNFPAVSGGVIDECAGPVSEIMYNFADSSDYGNHVNALDGAIFNETGGSHGGSLDFNGGHACRHKDYVDLFPYNLSDGTDSKMKTTYGKAGFEDGMTISFKFNMHNVLPIAVLANKEVILSCSDDLTTGGFRVSASFGPNYGRCPFDTVNFWIEYVNELGAKSVGQMTCTPLSTADSTWHMATIYVSNNALNNKAYIDNTSVTWNNFSVIHGSILGVRTPIVIGNNSTLTAPVKSAWELDELTVIEDDFADEIVQRCYVEDKTLAQAFVAEGISARRVMGYWNFDNDFYNDVSRDAYSVEYSAVNAIDAKTNVQHIGRLCNLWGNLIDDYQYDADESYIVGKGIFDDDKLEIVKQNYNPTLDEVSYEKLASADMPMTIQPNKKYIMKTRFVEDKIYSWFEEYYSEENGNHIFSTAPDLSANVQPNEYVDTYSFNGSQTRKTKPILIDKKGKFGFRFDRTLVNIYATYINHRFENDSTWYEEIPPLNYFDEEEKVKEYIPDFCDIFAKSEFKYDNRPNTIVDSSQNYAFKHYPFVYNDRMEDTLIDNFDDEREINWIFNYFDNRDESRGWLVKLAEGDNNDEWDLSNTWADGGTLDPIFSLGEIALINKEIHDDFNIKANFGFKQNTEYQDQKFDIIIRANNFYDYDTKENTLEEFYFIGVNPKGVTTYAGAGLIPPGTSNKVRADEYDFDVVFGKTYYDADLESLISLPLAFGGNSGHPLIGNIDDNTDSDDNFYQLECEFKNKILKVYLKMLNSDDDKKLLIQYNLIDTLENPNLSASESEINIAYYTGSSDKFFVGTYPEDLYGTELFETNYGRYIAEDELDGDGIQKFGQLLRKEMTGTQLGVRVYNDSTIVTGVTATPYIDDTYTFGKPYDVRTDSNSEINLLLSENDIKLEEIKNVKRDTQFNTYVQVGNYLYIKPVRTETKWYRWDGEITKFDVYEDSLIILTIDKKLLVYKTVYGGSEKEQSIEIWNKDVKNGTAVFTNSDSYAVTFNENFSDVEYDIEIVSYDVENSVDDTPTFTISNKTTSGFLVTASAVLTSGNVKWRASGSGFNFEFKKDEGEYKEYYSSYLDNYNYEVKDFFIRKNKVYVVLGNPVEEWNYLPYINSGSLNATIGKSVFEIQKPINMGVSSIFTTINDSINTWYEEFDDVIKIYTSTPIDKNGIYIDYAILYGDKEIPFSRLSSEQIVELNNIKIGLGDRAKYMNKLSEVSNTNDSLQASGSINTTYFIDNVKDDIIRVGDDITDELNWAYFGKSGNDVFKEDRNLTICTGSTSLSGGTGSVAISGYGTTLSPSTSSVALSAYSILLTGEENSNLWYDNKNLDGFNIYCGDSYSTQKVYWTTVEITSSYYITGY